MLRPTVPSRVVSEYVTYDMCHALFPIMALHTSNKVRVYNMQMKTKGKQHRATGIRCDYNIPSALGLECRQAILQKQNAMRCDVPKG